MISQKTRVGQDSGAGSESPFSSGRPLPLAWLPIPLLTVAIIAGRVAGLNEPHKLETLTLILSFFFYTLVSLGTLFIIGRSFLASGRPGLLLLECGVLLWSLSGTVGDAVSHGDANINVTIFNIGILLAGLCHLAGAILSTRTLRVLRQKPFWLMVAWVLTLSTLALIAQAALANWLPVFFIPGQGGTMVRYVVLISAIALFVLSAGLLSYGRYETHTPFAYWYVLALLLLAVGLFGIMIQVSLGSLVNWLARTAQWLGGVYLLLSALATQGRSNLFPLRPEKESGPSLYRDAVALVIVFAAAAVRLTFLSVMGTNAPYVIFFPAVMFAAIYGGRRAGLLATVLAAIITVYFWVEPVGQFALRHPSDWLGLVIFLLGGFMIAWIAEALHQARARASSAETQALLAADRAASAEVLSKSEERYHTLFTGMTEGFAIHELLTDESGRPVDYRFLDVNPAFERLTGLRRQDVVGRTHNEVLPGNDPKWLQIYSQVALTGQAIQFENYTPILKRHYEVFAYSPAPRQFATIFMDVTERKKAEEELSRTNQKLAQVLDSIQDDFYVLDHDWNFVYTSRQFASRIGKEPKDFIGKNIWEMFPKHRGTIIEENFRATMEKREIRRFEMGGQYTAAWYSMASFPSSEGITVLGTDITRRKQTEEALRENERDFAAIFERSVVGKAQTDPLTGRFTRVNQALADMLGYSIEELCQLTFVDITPPEDRDFIEAELEPVRSGRANSWQIEKRCLRKDGSLFWVNLSGNSIRHDDGRPARMIAVIQDITERKQAEEALKKAHDELEIRIQERTAELSEAVEKLRIENIQRKRLEETLRESESQVRFFASQYLKAQEDERRRIAGELHDSIAASLAAMKIRIERIAGEIKGEQDGPEYLKDLASKITEINNEVRRIMADLRPAILDDLGIIAALNWFCRDYQKTYSHITVENLIGLSEPEVPEFLKTPIFRISQEALNNIAKYSRASLVNLFLRLEDGKILLMIQDNGRGFDLNTVRKGLGLSTMQERTLLSGGSFSLESTEGQGTIVRAEWSAP